MLPDKSKEHGFGRVIRWAAEITSALAARRCVRKLPPAQKASPRRRDTTTPVLQALVATEPHSASNSLVGVAGQYDPLCAQIIDSLYERLGNVRTAPAVDRVMTGKAVSMATVAESSLPDASGIS
jgi:hypothetical protein